MHEMLSRCQREEPNKGNTSVPNEEKSVVIPYDSANIDDGKLKRQAAEIEEAVALLEQSQIVTQATMNLRFTI